MVKFVVYYICGPHSYKEFSAWTQHNKWTHNPYDPDILYFSKRKHAETVKLTLDVICDIIKVIMEVD